MTLTVPTVGLAEIRRIWAGRGGLWGLVADTNHPTDNLDWTIDAVRRRALRVALEVARPHLLAWPASRREWIDALPAQSVRHRSVADAPGPGADWVRTRLAGWPPREFHHRHRLREADSILVTTTRWTIETVDETLKEVHRLGAEMVPESDPLRARVAAARAALEIEPLASSHPTAPSRLDLVALRTSGRPWKTVAGVAEALQVVTKDPGRLADLALDPDPALADRLFHIAVLGQLIHDLRASGWRFTVTSLPGAPTGGPHLEAIAPNGEQWDLWYEMSGAWTHYNVPSPFATAARGLEGTGGPLGSDIALVLPHQRALIVECKFSDDPTYVGRGGYEQALAYMVEALTGLVTEVAGFVVGPDELITGTSQVSTAVGDLTFTPPQHLAQHVERASGEHSEPVVA